MVRLFRFMCLFCVAQGCLSTLVLAQGGFSVRHDAFGQLHARFCWGFEQNADGSFVVFGNGRYYNWADSLLYSSVATSERFDANGMFLSEDSVFIQNESTYVGWTNCSTILPDGRIVVSGAYTHGADTNNAALYWFSQSGELLNIAEFLPNSSSWIAYQHKNTPDGGFILTGVTSATGFQDIFLLKTDSLGTVEWWQTYGHPTRLDYSASVDHAPNGGYYIGGKYPTGINNGDQWVLRTDSIGGLLWDYTYGTPLDDYPSAHLTSTADGNCVFGSGWRTNIAQNHQFCLVKIDTSGNVMWQQTYDEQAFDETFFVVQEVTPGGDLIACGQRGFNNGMGGGYFKGTLLRTNNQGDSLWMRHYFYQDSLMSDGEGSFRDVQPTPDGGFIAVGQIYWSASGNDPPGYSPDSWVVKVDSMGCVQPGCNIVTGIEGHVTNLRDAIKVYPNPASSNTTVQVELPQSMRNSQLRLVLVSAQGQLVMEVSATLGKNMLDLSGLAAGLYYVHLANEDTWLSGTKLVIE